MSDVSAKVEDAKRQSAKPDADVRPAPAAQETAAPAPGRDIRILRASGVAVPPPNPRTVFNGPEGRRRGADHLRTAYMVDLQRTYGNREVARLLAQPSPHPSSHPTTTPPCGPDAAGHAQTDTDPIARSTESLPLQRGWFDDAVGAVGDVFSGAAAAVGSAVTGVSDAVSGAINAVGGAARAVGGWLADRARDLGMWVINLFRDLPGRLLRLAQTLVDGLVGIATFIPEAIGALITGGVAGLGRWLGEKLMGGLAWAGTLISRLLDVIGGPEIAEFILHLLASGTTPLTAAERQAAQQVLGASALRWDDVRVAEGGLIESVIFRLNNRRAFTTFHTINMPRGGRDLATMVHELTHVYQYEKVGSLYIGQAIHAQVTAGYNYGGKAGLAQRRATGQTLRDLNREQQAQLAEDYFQDNRAGDPDYEPFIAELRAGQL
ncbi:MAG: hypothetical protein ACRDJW_14225 [Thermomicrobiales bacterium]